MGFSFSAGFAAVRSRLVNRVPKCRTSYVYSLAHMLIPVTFTHADTPLPLLPTPPLNPPLLAALYRCRLQLRCLPFSAVQSGLGPQMGSNHQADGFRWQASKEAEKVEAALAQDEAGSDCSGLQMEISLTPRNGGREQRRIMQPHMSMWQMKGNGESTWSLSVIPEKWLKLFHCLHARNVHYAESKCS